MFAPEAHFGPLLGRWLGVLVVSISVAACVSSSPAPPELLRVEPAQIYSFEAVTSRLVGTGFTTHVLVDVTSRERPNVQDGFTVELAGRTFTKPAVRWRSLTELELELPAGLPVGTWDLTLTTPGGRSTTLAQALRVVDAPVLSIEDAPGGSGSPLGTTALHVGQLQVLFAVAREPGGAFHSDPAASWSVSGGGSLTIMDGSQSTFVATAEGGAMVSAFHSVFGAAEAVSFTVDGCSFESDAALCERFSYVCGSLDATDLCGDQRSVTCGSCDSCANTCIAGACQPTSHVATACWAGDVYWLDSCSDTEAMEQDCTTDQICLAAACCTPESDAELCGAEGQQCDLLATTDACGVPRSMDCGACPCAACPTCNTTCSLGICIPAAQTSAACHEGDVYWLDSCGAVGELLLDCTTDQSCVSASCQSSDTPEGQANCTHLAWATTVEVPTTISDAAYLVDPPPRGSTWAQGDWDAATIATVSGFSAQGHAEALIGVDAAVMIRSSGMLSADGLEAQVLFDGNTYGARSSFATDALNATVSGANLVYADLTAVRPWAWSDLDGGSLGLWLRHFGPGVDGVTTSIDLVGYRISYVCNTPPYALLNVSPLAGTTATSFSFDAAASTDTEDEAAALVARWDYDGDGVWDTAFSATLQSEHSYAVSGVYEARVEVRDSAGALHQALAMVSIEPDVGDSVLTVTTELDEADAGATPASPGGAGFSLREAINFAEGASDPQTILFDAPMTITLTAVLPGINTQGDVIVVGIPGPDGPQVVVDAAGVGVGECLEFSTDNNALYYLEIRGCPGTIANISTSNNQIAYCKLGPSGAGLFVGGAGNIIGPGNEIYASDAQGLQVQAATQILYNRIHSNATSGLFLGNGSAGSTLVGNLVYRNGEYGLWLGVQADSQLVWHNTFASNVSSGINIQSQSDSNDVQNNIFYANGGWGIFSAGSSLAILDSNLWFANTAGTCSACSLGSANIQLDPRLTDPQSDDYLPLSDSPAVDAGTDLMDVNGSAPGRYHGLGPDVGALERH